MGGRQFESRSEEIREVIREEKITSKRDIAKHMYDILTAILKRGFYIKKGKEIKLTEKMKKNREKASEELQKKYNL